STVADAGGRDVILEMEHVRLTPAGRDGRLIAMDGMALLGFGPRTAETARALFRTLHPDVDRR
ncbi:MAG TPA: hemin ABC transporter substrate-binding protein, partial [Alphaproteobacteria bacterium]|nr:hemin ABC transporter substrate-binding protein [Alphaproteobacteria bacterium]